MSLRKGMILNNRYRVLRPLGEGGFGRAYLVEDAVMNRQCVVKASRRHSGAHRIQFEREVKMLARLNHPNLPEVYDYFVENDQPYLAMEYIEGTDLRKLARGLNQAPAVNQVLRWADDLLDALIYLHNRDPPVIHRDIKPSNVCITPEGKAVLLDFGIARLLEGTHTLTGAQALTKHYAPIEQYPAEAAGSYERLRQYLEELKTADIHTGSYSDVYSLGATLYFALTLLDPPDACWRVIGEEALAVRKYNPAVPGFVIGALDQALTVDPRERCHTAAKLKQLLHPTSKPLPPSPPLLWKWIAVGIGALLAVFAGLFLSGLVPEWFGGPTRRSPSLVPSTATPSSTSTPLLSITPEPSFTPSAIPTTPSPAVTPTSYLTVSDEQLDVYTGPGEIYDVLGRVRRGDRLLILGRSEDEVWFQVDYLGWHGWVAAQSVVVDVDPMALPTAETPPMPLATVSAEPTVGPTSFSIVFDSYRDDNWEMYMVDENGSGLVNLTDNPANDGDPAWSFDGKRIAFDSDRDGNWEIYAMNTDGSVVTRLTNHPAEDSSPAWSPDGLQVAFKSNRDGNWEIYLINLDDSGVANLTNHPADDRVPAWSPDGQRIAFVSDRTGDWDIWIMNADGSNLVNLTRHPARDSFPAWSPDGRRIAFHSYRDDNAEIYVMNADGSDLIRLTSDQADDWGPSWSPDGLRLAFTSDRDGDNEIYIIDMDGGNVVQVTHNEAHDTWPVWSPMPYVQ